MSTGHDGNDNDDATLSPTAYVACPVCGQIHTDVPLERGTAAFCVRCDARLDRRTTGSLHLTTALTIAAIVLYIPANVFPILYLNLYGRRTSNTVWDGVRVFYEDGLYAMAVIVLLASIVIPVFKFIGLLYLVASVRFGQRRATRFRTELYRFIDRIGRWAMLDVFVLAIWVATVKLRTLGEVTPGEGLLPFGCVVALTLLASSCFDPRLLWDREDVKEPASA